MQVFSEKRDKQLYFAKALWVTMQCHMVMDEFEELGFGTHVLISSLFTRFLAEQTGSNFASGIAAKIESGATSNTPIHCRTSRKLPEDSKS